MVSAVIRPAFDRHKEELHMSDLVVIAFPAEAKAEDVRRKLLAMQEEYLIEMAMR